jgi:hypothetical protein
MGDNQTLFDLARDQAAPFARFLLTNEKQHETLAAFVEQSHRNAILKQAQIEEKLRKRRNPAQVPSSKGERPTSLRLKRKSASNPLGLRVRPAQWRL